MPYNVVKFNHSNIFYLGFDDSGNHKWKRDRLDAIRFDHEDEACMQCDLYLKIGAKITKCDDEDGRYEFYKNYEIQIYQSTWQKCWCFRTCPIMEKGRYEYYVGKGFVTHLLAIEAAKSFVNRKGVVSQLKITHS